MKGIKAEKEVMNALEELQMTQEEKKALKELEEYTEKMKDTGEYEGMTGEEDAEILEKYDELEMIYDMNAYECVNYIRVQYFKTLSPDMHTKGLECLRKSVKMILNIKKPGNC